MQKENVPNTRLFGSSHQKVFKISRVGIPRGRLSRTDKAEISSADSSDRGQDAYRAGDLPVKNILSALTPKRHFKKGV